MNSERHVTLVAGYEAVFGKTPSDVAKAGLTATLAAVLSTFRSDNPDSAVTTGNEPDIKSSAHSPTPFPGRTLGAKENMTRIFAGPRP